MSTLFCKKISDKNFSLSFLKKAKGCLKFGANIISFPEAAAFIPPKSSCLRKSKHRLLDGGACFYRFVSLILRSVGEDGNKYARKDHRSGIKRLGLVLVTASGRGTAAASASAGGFPFLFVSVQIEQHQNNDGKQNCSCQKVSPVFREKLQHGVRSFLLRSV